MQAFSEVTGRRRSRMFGAAVPLALLSMSFHAASLQAQEIPRPTLPPNLEYSRGGPGLFVSEDAMLVALFAANALFMEPLEGVDQPLTRLASDEGVQGKTLVRAGPRALGTLPGTMAFTGGIYLLGNLTGHSALARAGMHSLQAALLADGVTAVFKIGVGRGRPSVNAGDSDELSPFKFNSDHYSFPSGHSSKIFAVAATLSSELGDEAPWVPFVAYPLAAWTASTRVLDRKHWVTDVVAGAALGVLSSRFVERLHHGRGPERGGVVWTLVPGVDGGIGFALSVPAP